MAFQAIIYDENGKVCRVIDPMGDFEFPAPGSAELTALANPPIGGGVLLYRKSQRDVVLRKWGHEFYLWQGIVDEHLGKSR